MDAVIKYEGHFAKYSYKISSRSNKTIIYQGTINLIPFEYEHLVEKDNKYCIIYTLTKS